MKSFQVLSNSQLYKIHEASLEVLEKTGVIIHNEQALRLLKDSGAQLDPRNKIVKIPSYLVEEALRDAPRSILLAGRNPKHDLRLARKRVHCGTSTSCLNTFDVSTGERRPTTKDDLAAAARVADALPNIDFVNPFFSFRSPCVGLHELDALLRNTEKPVVCQDYGNIDVGYYVKLAAVVAGGKEALQDRPNILLYCEPISPLTHADSHVRAVMTFAKARLPTMNIPCPASGATAPATLAGTLVQSNSEVLSGIVIAQLTNRGAPVVYGGLNGPMDMRTLNRITAAAPQRLLTTLAIAQLGRYYGLPVDCSGGSSTSKVLDFQAVIEGTLSLFVAIASGANLIHGPGMMEFGMTGSLEQLTSLDETISMAKHFFRGIELTDETLALDLIREVGPGGNYLAREHTKQWFRKEQWYPELMDWWDRTGWEARGSKSYQERVREKTLEILKTHIPEPLPKGTLEDMDKIIRDAEKNPNPGGISDE